MTAINSTMSLKIPQSSNHETAGSQSVSNCTANAFPTVGSVPLNVTDLPAEIHHFMNT